MSLNIIETSNNLGPFYMDQLNVNHLFNTQSATQTFSFSMTGAYTGGSGKLFVSKYNDWISIAINQTTTATVTSTGQGLFLSATLPTNCLPQSTILNFPATVINGGVPVAGRVSILNNGTIEVTTLDNLGFGAGVAGMQSFSCQFSNLE